jgi:Fanconi anemia group D2 protein
MNQCVLIFQGITHLARHNVPSTMLVTALRKGRQFIDVFLKAMPFLSASFMDHHARIVALLRHLQHSTRAMQTLCAHCKVENIAGALRLVPAVKKSLETLIFRVKAMLVENNCVEAFSLGTLKHRNLAGEEVPSQIAEASSQYSDSEDDSEPQVDENQEEDEEEGLGGGEEDDEASEVDV